jgi:hypothetical protein
MSLSASCSQRTKWSLVCVTWSGKVPRVSRSSNSACSSMEHDCEVRVMINKVPGGKLGYARTLCRAMRPHKEAVAHSPGELKTLKNHSSPSIVEGVWCCLAAAPTSVEQPADAPQSRHESPARIADLVSQQVSSATSDVVASCCVVQAAHCVAARRTIATQSVLIAQKLCNPTVLAGIILDNAQCSAFFMSSYSYTTHLICCCVCTCIGQHSPAALLPQQIKEGSLPASSI